MSKTEERIRQIKEQLVGDTQARVLLVEGPDDVDAYRIFLGRQYPDWEKSWRIEAAGRKAAVIDMAALEADWIGLVDRDEWDAREVHELGIAHPNLKFLPRFCLESYLIDPDELWAALPQKQRQKIAGGVAQLRAEIFHHKAA